MSCSSIDLKAYLLGETSQRERSLVEDHVRTCQSCREEQERLRIAHSALRVARRRRGSAADCVCFGQGFRTSLVAEDLALGTGHGLCGGGGIGGRDSGACVYTSGGQRRRRSRVSIRRRSNSAWSRK